MPKRAIGLRGYVGELIVEQWLCKKHHGCKIVRQILPDGVEKVGGPYLDFGVIRGGAVEEVYEVKAQDYILGRDTKTNKAEINKALIHIWDRGPGGEYTVQNCANHYADSGHVRGFLILLASPNSAALAAIGQKNIDNIILFEEILHELGSDLNEAELIRIATDDIRQSIQDLRNPTAGKTLLEPFRSMRKKANEMRK
jgi:hypothetical protein